MSVLVADLGISSTTSPHAPSAASSSSSSSSVHHRSAAVASSSISSSPSLSTTIPPHVHRHAVAAAASSSSPLEQLKEKIVKEKKATWEEMQRLYASADPFFASPAELVIEHLDLTGFQEDGNTWDRLLQRVVRSFPAVHSIDAGGPHFTDAHLQLICQGLVSPRLPVSRLKRLHLDSCPSITTLAPIVNHDCAYIEELLIRNCPRLTIAHFREISGVFRNLTSLTLRLNIDLAVPIRILGQHLTYLDLSGCSLLDGHMYAIGDTCSRLRTLLLHSDVPTRAAAGLYTLSDIGQRMPHLNYLSINWFRIGGPACTLPLRQLFFRLQTLAIGYCPEDRFAQEVFQAFPRVPNIDFSRCSQLTDAALPEICYQKFIDLSGCPRMTSAAIARLMTRSPLLSEIRLPNNKGTLRLPALASSSSSSSSTTTTTSQHQAAAPLRPPLTHGMKRARLEPSPPPPYSPPAPSSSRLQSAAIPIALRKEKDPQ